jgi:hypothetical protein
MPNLWYVNESGRFDASVAVVTPVGAENEDVPHQKIRAAPQVDQSYLGPNAELIFDIQSDLNGGSGGSHADGVSRTGLVV